MVHKYYPVSDHRLRLRWVPVFVEQGSEVLGSGSRTSEEQVAVNRIICTTQLHDGVIAHAVARRLDLAGYSFDEDAFKYDAPVNAAIVQDQEQLVHKAALFCTPDVQRSKSSGSQVPKPNSPLQRENMELRKWLSLKRVDFAEIYRGFGEFTIRVREGGRTAAEGFDNAAITYERTWHLDRQDQADLAWLLCYVHKPKVVHLGTPCTKMCVLGKQQIDQATEMQNEFTRKVVLHQQAHSWKASVEQPKVPFCMSSLSLWSTLAGSRIRRPRGNGTSVMDVNCRLSTQGRTTPDALSTRHLIGWRILISVAWSCGAHVRLL